MITGHAALSAILRCAAIFYAALLTGGCAAAAMWRTLPWEVRMVRLLRRMDRRT